MPHSLRMMAVYSGFWIAPPVVPAFQATALPQRRPPREARVLRPGVGGGAGAGVGEGAEVIGAEALPPPSPHPATVNAARPASASRRVVEKGRVIPWRAPCAARAGG